MSDPANLTTSLSNTSAGFGFGVWRNIYDISDDRTGTVVTVVAWSFCFGPFTIHKVSRVYRSDRDVVPKEVDAVTGGVR